MTFTPAEGIILALLISGIFYYLHSEKGKAELAKVEAQLPTLEANIKAHVTDAVSTLKTDAAKAEASLKAHISAVSAGQPLPPPSAPAAAAPGAQEAPKTAGA